ncbi:helix-turn-helix domain-containing protein [Nocardia farcinica]|uniref:helix-turn-helix domain-containing protein n=1 Tax=Nocardia TaxID=1817 RepID=UPI000BF243BA|nr:MULTISPECIES: helix-turn-helix domain-containing protein [Nocardia]MBF6262493.1 helix-turn-helix domain-containing protein [Nocardia farcinica]MBF6284361.1 helix-turn-helix domain-containing protein [Nocardia farcinica]MBF6308861.1 helix-turn-helix domain-containing protein [Nocardia farcinica]MBF6314084.1 helix-turn-helix domain-containing protein [Nocardia farcinica]MBF6390887.1 helix-turn-helix domain-containing protein [Nocardia farcinica]
MSTPGVKRLVRCGEVVREHRENAGYTQQQLADLSYTAVSTIQKIELGKREPNRQVLRRIFDALDVFPLAQDYLMSLADQPREVQERLLADETSEVQEQDLALLDSLHHPACIQRPATFNVVAANDEFYEMYPGIKEVGNALYYHLLDPRAKYVVADWEAQAQLFVSAFHCLAPALMTREKWDAMVRELSTAPEFVRMYKRRMPPNQFIQDRTTVTTRNPATNSEQVWYRNVTTMIFPYQRSTWYMSFHPVTPHTRHFGERGQNDG